MNKVSDFSYYYNKKSEAHEKALEHARTTVRVASNKIEYMTWRPLAIDSFGFYDGNKQWPADVLAQLKRRGQSPIVVNKTKALVNQVSGVEIQSRFKTGYRSHRSPESDEEKLANALTHHWMYVQEDQETSYKNSNSYRDTLICGLGYSYLYQQNGRTYSDYIHPLSIIYDSDDSTPQFTNSGFIICKRWIDGEVAQGIWPKHAKRIRDLFSLDNSFTNSFDVSLEYQDRTSSIIDESVYGTGGFGSKIPVFEVQYKKPRKYYSGLDYKGNYFETFDKERAAKLAGGEKSIEEESGTEILRTVFCRDILLEYAPLTPNIPNRQDFSYIPCVWSRRSSDGVPEGWIETIKPLQMELNYRKFKEINGLNSVRAVVDEGAFQGMGSEEIRDELSRPDTVLIKVPGTEVNIDRNLDVAQSQIASAERLDQEIQQVSGAYNDLVGAPSDVKSGVAIQRRQVASVRNQVVGFDNLRLMKKRQGKLFLDMLQGSDQFNIESQILTEDEFEEIVFNMKVEYDGKEYIFNDIRTIPLSVYVEETADYSSSPEEEQETLQTLLSNPIASLLLQSPTLMKMSRIKQADKIAEEIKKINQENAQMKMGGGRQMPLPEMMPNDGIQGPTQVVG